MKKHFLLFGFIFILLQSNNFAQDTQYWAKQFGTYGELLGGVVVGGISDLSSTYYNPGSTAFSTDSALILTTNSLQAYLITYKDVFGTGNTLTSSSVKTSPGILAVRLPFKSLLNNEVIVSYIARYNFDLNAHSLDTEDYKDSENEYQSNDVLISYSLNEYWPGITWARKISSNVGLGVTLYVPYRYQKSRNQVIMQKRDSLGVVGQDIAFEDYSYFNLRMLLKFGASFDLTPVRLGFSITTPSINIFGIGEDGVNLVSSNRGYSLSENLPDFASNYQDNLSTTFYSPLSIAVGASYYMENTSFYFSMEWFNSLSSFNVMNPKPFEAQSTGEVFEYNSSYSSASVINWGIGIKYILSESFTYYGSITTDKTSFNPNSFNKFAISNWDILHLRFGGMFDIQNLSITLGLGYGFTTNLYKGFRLFGENVDREDASVTYHQLDAIFGFSYKL